MSDAATATLTGAEVVNRSSAAALALLVYDILLTFDEEVSVIWPRRWTGMKCLFFVIRYMPVLLQIPTLFVGTELSPHFHYTYRDCMAWSIYRAVAPFVIMVAVDYILILRVFALYNNSRAIKVIISILFLLDLLTMVISMGFSLSVLGFDDSHLCVVTHFPMYSIVYSASAIMFQTCLFLLTLFRFIGAVRTGWGSMPIISLVVRDGMWAYFLAVAIYDLSMLAFKNPSFGGIFHGWMLTGFSFSGYRMLLNLGTSSERDRTKRSELEFAPPSEDHDLSRDIESKLDTL
ncbi:hypothetical protein C8R44DRAFT_984099 [Mycena epipterygia]|nr:hypothetical protein C8R44DRAFT_984099 [Mycena epipterygia]